jgi:hypothetical protein
MNHRNRVLLPKAARPPKFIQMLTFCAIAALGVAWLLPAAAQPAPAAARQSAIAAQAPSERDVADTQDQLLKLLRLSPVLTSVVARDPSLLSDQQYVARNNPELAQFMAAHPDIAKNPEFYLFSRLNHENGRRDQVLERAVWPDLVPADHAQSAGVAFVDRLVPIIVVPCFLFAFVWIVNLFVQSHRWNRAFKQQSEIHARLIDKFSSNQELAAYMETEAGKRFLEISPAASGLQTMQHMPNAVARVLTPLQVGIVMTLLGIGFILLRHAGPDMETPMVVLGTLALMPGIGFILSAGVTWVLAQRLGLLPDKAEAHQAAAPFGSPDRQ